MTAPRRPRNARFAAKQRNSAAPDTATKSGVATVALMNARRQRRPPIDGGAAATALMHGRRQTTKQRCKDVANDGDASANVLRHERR